MLFLRKKNMGGEQSLKCDTLRDEYNGSQPVKKTRGSVTEWLFVYVPQKNSPLPPQLHATHRLNNTAVTAIK